MGWVSLSQGNYLKRKRDVIFMVKSIIFKSIVSSLTDNELRRAYSELKEWMNTGLLKQDGLVKQVHDKCEAQLNMEIDLRTVENQILYEIADRFLNQSN
jgi:hypothetical protein